jgi:hypothetical protein
MKLRRLAAVSVVIALAMAALAPAAKAGPPGKWTKVTSGDVSLIDEPGLYRGANNHLHIAYHRDDGSTVSYRRTTLSASGNAVSTGTILNGWGSLTRDPKLISGPSGGIRLVFSGIGAGPYASGYMYTSTAAADGTGWSLYNGSMSTAQNAYGSYGSGAVALEDGTPVASWTPSGTTVYWHVGADPSIPATTPNGSTSMSSCCVYNSTLVRSGNKVYLAWYANGDTGAAEGTFVKQILPSAEATMKAPGSSTLFNGTHHALSPDQAVAMAARVGGGVYVAFCRGYPTCDNIGLWKVGTDTVRTVPGSSGVDSIALTAGPKGRLWVTWTKQYETTIYASRTNTTATKFGVVRSVRGPTSSATIYRLAAEGSTGRVDVVAGDSDAKWHTQILAGLKLAASPTKWDGDASKTVTFTVTDAGEPIAKAKVTVGSRACTTGSAGVCKISFPTLAPQKLTAAATKSGYAKGTVRLTVLA